MRKIKDFFDYIFYRVYKQYEKWKEGYPYPFAEGVVILIQWFIILNILDFFSLFSLIPKKIENGKILAFTTIVILILLNKYRYSKKYYEIVKHFDKLPDPNRKRNGFLIIILIIFLILYPLVIGILRNNLGYNI